MDAVTEAYIEEANELLAELESSLLELEETPTDSDIIARVFRALHTIKGSSGMFGFDHIAEFTHDVETVFDLVRDDRMPVTQELINLTLGVRDQILTMLTVSPDDASYDKTHAEEIITSLKMLIPKDIDENDIVLKPMPAEQPKPSLNEYPPQQDIPHHPSPIKSVESSSTIMPKTIQETENKDEDIIEDDGNGIEKTYRIRFVPSLDLLKNGGDPIVILKELNQLGECVIVAQNSRIPDWDDFDPESCYTYWDAVLTTAKGMNAIKDIFIFVEDECDIAIDMVDSEMDEDLDYKKIGEILIERKDIGTDDLMHTLKGQKRLGEILVEKHKVSDDAIQSALAEQTIIKQKRRQRQEAETSTSIRVAADKLDLLVDLVGELVTVQARLTQTASFHKLPELVAIAEEVERLTAELRDNTMSIRMLPIGTTFNKFKRLVRDLSGELGKKVLLATDGGETELDKTVIEQLNDPLVHIIRNSIDHGIEIPSIRIQAGKTDEGTVKLSASHSGSNVIIQITDDGAGLDVDKIREKAIQKELISPDDDKTDKEIFMLIFSPGFSTADRISEVSGRGVGMDVVKRCIENLRGSIEVDSEKGKGTVITLKLPLTLAIIEGLLVKIGEGYFVVPLSSIEECVELPKAELAKVKRQSMMNLRDEIVPFLNLRELFDIVGPPPAIEQIVIAEAHGDRVGFGVDHVVGQIQTVIKSLGKMYRDIIGLSGATILGDGTVALILDVVQLVQTVESENDK